MSDESISKPEWPTDAWRLRVQLNVPASSLRAIQFAIVSQDPIAQFKTVLTRMEKHWRAQLEQIKDPERRQTTKQLQRTWGWNHLFHPVPGDEVYLLLPGSAELIMSNSSAGTKWVVTKPVVLRERRLCWGMCFQAVAGQEAELKLSEDTALDLHAIQNPSGIK